MKRIARAGNHDRMMRASARPIVQRTARTLCTVSLTGLLLGGCTLLGPDFERPQVPWLESWRSAELENAEQQEGELEAASAADQAWWHNFNDPVLDALIDEAQRRNPDARIAGLRILEARAQLGIAGSGLYPQVQQIDGQLLRVGEESDAGSSSFTTAGVGASIAWEIDFWGRFRRGIEAADANYLATIARADEVQVLVAAQTANLYCNVRILELRLRIARDNAALQKRSLEITERLFASGNESELDLQQARALYLSTLSTIPELEAGLRQTHNGLSVLLGRPPGELPELATGREQIPVAPLAVVVDLPADLLRRRPDVRSAELQLAAQSALIGISEADLYPSIALIGSVGLSSTSANWSADTLEWGVGPSLVWNVFDYGRLKNQVLVQDARFQQLYEVYQQTVLQAARELDDAAVAFVRSGQQAALLQQSVVAAKRSLDIATTQYREGLVDFQRVLDTQRSLFSQQERLVASRGSVSLNLIALYKAMGGGWQLARSQPLLDDATRATMNERSNWGDLLDAPLPAVNDDRPMEAEPQ